MSAIHESIVHFTALIFPWPSALYMVRLKSKF